MIAISPQTVLALGPLTEGHGWVAFFQSRSRAEALVKIEATKNLSARVRAIDNDNPHEISLLGLIEAAQPTVAAKAIQHEHETARTKGEWFSSTVALLAFVEATAQAPMLGLVRQLRPHTAPFLTAEELASILQVSLPTIYRWVKDGKIPSFRVGNQLRFVAADVLTSVRQS